MAVMKQMEECLSRAFNGQAPIPSRKWKGIMEWKQYDQTYILHLYHYQHLVLKYDIKRHVSLYEWWEKQADKRGLDSAKEWLEERRRKYDNIGR